MKLQFSIDKTIFHNIVSLSILNVLNMALPLVCIPYLIAKIGSANYGAYSIAYTILQYVLLIGTFGFNCTTTRQIVQRKDDIEYVSKVFTCTLVAKFILTLAASLLLLGLVLAVFPKYLLLYLFGLGIAFGDILNPVWLFQGMEDMKYMTIVNAIAKTLFTILIFIFIRCEDDYIYITLLNSAGFVVSGIFSLFLAVKIFHVRFVKVSMEDVFFQIKESSVVFFSTAFISFYNNSFVFILGLFLSEASIGIYAAVEKIIKAAKSVIEPISTALFPHVAKSFVGKAQKDNVALLFSYAKRLAVLLLMMSMGLVIFAPLIGNFFLKTIASESIFLIRVMSPLVFLGGLNYLFGVVGLINLGRQKDWLRILIVSNISSIAVLLACVHSLDYFAAVIAGGVAEGLICVLSYFRLKRLV